MVNHAELNVPKHRFEVLDVFRGIFAFFVFLFHLSPFADTPIIRNNLVHHSDLFVDFFFVLSGFVISYNYREISTTEGAFSFLKKRLKRIYPLHLFMLVLFLIIEVAKGFLANHISVNNPNNASNNIYSFVLNILLLNSTPLLGNKDVSWNIVSWSISAEMIAYIVFACSLLFTTKVKWFRNKQLLVVMTILLAAVVLLVNLTGGYRILYTFDYGFLRGIIGFYVGVICLNFFERSYKQVVKIHQYAFIFAEFAIILLILTFIYHAERIASYGLVFELLFFACIYIFSFEKGLISSAFKKNGLLKKIGKYSYSIYMTHAFMISIFNIIMIRILKFPSSAYAYLFVLNFILIYLFSAWTYKNIEMRFYAPSNKKKPTP